MKGFLNNSRIDLDSCICVCKSVRIWRSSHSLEQKTSKVKGIWQELCLLMKNDFWTSLSTTFSVTWWANLFHLFPIVCVFLTFFFVARSLIQQSLHLYLNTLQWMFFDVEKAAFFLPRSVVLFQAFFYFKNVSNVSLKNVSSPSQISWLFIQSPSYSLIWFVCYDLCGPASDSSLFLSPLDQSCGMIITVASSSNKTGEYADSQQRRAFGRLPPEAGCRSVP